MDILNILNDKAIKAIEKRKHIIKAFNESFKTFAMWFIVAWGIWLVPILLEQLYYLNT
ncbi:hypothetical protein [Acetivibrio saccincola]|jgi:hypothetical protein|uniref:Uncharacterized protein n=1 Tax=Acetivibrio saccincola TaxID=1677857 RepID=A0A2K9EEF5_9FIRM|nr:hypothetical protein [Acetivibrio saccincola]AUG57595.1 hypothetical protein HVS_08435 [Acetivibrio saccincola]NLP45330.1 hypothetical protein [Peptococcaceae bacterium]